MIELVLVYCLASDMQRCLEPHETRREVGSPMACTVEAQTVAQEYLAIHRQFRLSGWRCEVDRPREYPL